LYRLAKVNDFRRCGRAAKTYVLRRGYLTLKTSSDSHRIHFRYCIDRQSIMVTPSP
jgi:hypothetical protein